MDNEAQREVDAGGVAANERLTRETLSANERVTTQNRIEDKRADAYLELLRSIERKGLALESTLGWLDAGTEPDYGQPQPRRSERPPLSDRSAIRALLAALGSPALQLRTEAWFEKVKQFDDEYDSLAFDWLQNSDDPNEPIDRKSLDLIRAALQSEMTERREVAKQIVQELNSHQPR